MNKSKIDNVQLEQKLNSEQMMNCVQSPPADAKPNVGGSFCPKDTTTKERTAMQQLVDKLKVAIGDHDLSKTEYGSGYKQCLISIKNDIEIQMLSIEERQIKNALMYGTLGLSTEDMKQFADNYFNAIFTHNVLS